MNAEVKKDRDTVEQMVIKLKEEIKFMNVFVILFNGEVLQGSYTSFFSYASATEDYRRAEAHDRSV